MDKWTPPEYGLGTNLNWIPLWTALALFTYYYPPDFPPLIEGNISNLICCGNWSLRYSSPSFRFDVWSLFTVVLLSPSSFLHFIFEFPPFHFHYSIGILFWIFLFHFTFEFPSFIFNRYFIFDFFSVSFSSSLYIFHFRFPFPFHCWVLSVSFSSFLFISFVKFSSISLSIFLPI